MTVTKTDFAEIAGVSRRTVHHWVEKGLPTVPGSRERIDIIEGLKWQYLNATNSPFKGIIKPEDEDELSIEDKLRLKRIEKLEQEIAIKKGELIPNDEVDQNNATMVSLLINQFRQLLKVLPKMLAKKTETQIKKALDQAFEKRVKELEKMFREESNVYREENPSSD